MYDEIAEQIIIEEIEKAYPKHSILSEEVGLINKNSPELWIIDPLDGTGNYVNHNPFFAVSISLWIDGEPQIAVIEAPALRERYIAVKGEGAQLDNTATGKSKPTKVSDTKDIRKAYITFCEGGAKDRQQVLKTINDFYTHVKDMRKLGSAALECAWVGLGRADAYITHDISLWDIAAGVLFVVEAGGGLLKFNFQPFPYSEIAKLDDMDIIISNGHLNLVSDQAVNPRGFCLRC